MGEEVEKKKFFVLRFVRIVVPKESGAVKGGPVTGKIVQGIFSELFDGVVASSGKEF